MNWENTRHLLGPLARFGGHERTPGPEAATPDGHELHERPRAASLCVASGKGGTGKSIVSASLASLLARRAPTLIVDADLGVGNAHILQDVAPERSFVDVIEGRASVSDVRIGCRPGLDLLAAGSGVSRMAGLTAYELHLVACGLENLEHDYGYVVIDSAAGISNQTIAFAAASDVVLIVTTPDVTALTDAYAFFKVLLQRRPDCTPLFVVNRSTSEEEGLHVADRMRAVTHRFLGREPRYVGALPDDRAVVRSVHDRRPVIDSEPGSPCAERLCVLEFALATELARVGTRGLGRSLLRTVGTHSGPA
jgi:flagellar biosynthesis protein FlhG